jgi:hypothetical protein
MKNSIFVLFAILLSGTLTCYAQNKRTESGKAVDELTESGLPIVVINPSGEIKDEDRIYAHMGIIWNKGEKRNHISDHHNDYDGRIMIELHGKSSLMFDKKSYRFETQKSNRQNLNTSILDMPAEDDWILYGPYSDKTLLRNFLIYTLAGEINDYAPRVRFCEVIVDSEYQGIYVMTEKIEVDNDRVDIAELSPQDNSEPAITGGYIFRKDKIDPGDNLLSLAISSVDLIINEPKADEINEAQEQWLRDHLYEFDRQLHNEGNYADYVNVESFVYNFLIVEFAKNIDGYRLSTYFHKDREEKIVAGPVWDYNFSLGNADYHEGWSPQGWYYPLITENQLFWFKEMIEDPKFINYSGRLWSKLRKDQFSLHHIFSLIDHWKGKLDEARKRNFSKYQILGRYLWPNPGYPQSGSYGYNAPKTGGPLTWEEEIEQLKDFIRNRLKWMDEQFGLTSMKIRLKVDEPPHGKIIHNQHIINDSSCTEIFREDSILHLTAFPSQGYRFKHWVKTKVGDKTGQIIKKGSTWRYFDQGNEPADEWAESSYNDSAWKEGEAQLGYGDGDEKTVISYGGDANNKFVTTYFRHRFTIEDTNKYEKLIVELLVDDGAVVYLNGEEAFRYNMPEGTIYYDTFASGYLSDGEESTFKSFNINEALLIHGENVLAVEVHQANRTSSDVSFDLGLSGIIKSEDSGPLVIGEERNLSFKLKDNVSLITAHFEKNEQDTVSPVINEFLALNNSGIRDDFFERDDWIELYNPLNRATDIGGLFVSDDPRGPRKYQIPDDVPEKTTIDPKDYLILWADNDSAQGPLHLNFRLDKDSETITLARENNDQLIFLDVVSFFRQTSDVSRGRLPDGTLSWRFFNIPTPGESNKIIEKEVGTENHSQSLNYILNGNYPNPFKNFTTIGYYIPRKEHVNISIYNSLGHLVKILVNKPQPAGSHTVHWHASELPAGIYFYKMTCGSYSEVKRALIMR